MARTFRANPTKLPVKGQTKVKDGSRTKPAASCENHGSCAYCQSNRMHKHRRKGSNVSVKVDNVSSMDDDVDS